MRVIILGMKLSDSMITRITNDTGKQVFLWDRDVPGFGVRISKRRKSYVIRLSLEGKREIRTIGHYGILDTATARSIAKNEILTAYGCTPRITTARTVSQVGTDYIELISSKTKKSWVNDSYNLSSHIEPAFGDTPITDLTTIQIDKWHKNIPAKYNANRTLALLSTICNQAIKWGELNNNPCKGVSKNKEYSRDVFIEKDFYPTFLEAVEKEEAPYPTIIKLLLHTGLRKTELLSLKWENVDLDSSLAKIPTTKNGRPHMLPLTKVAVGLIKELPKDNDYLFHYQGYPLLDIKRPWDRIRTRINRPDLRIHDLRRTIGSWLAQSGVSLHLIGEVLNHKNPKTTMVYARFQKGHVREAIEGAFE